MWFEGRVPLKDFPATFAQHMQAIPAGQSKPMWEMVSSNVGNTLEDNGYVLYSRGSSGKDNLFIGVKNAYFSKVSAWHLGHQFFIAENYTPNSESGQNGTLSGVLTQGHRYQYTADYNGTTINDFIVNYKMSVTKDRVVLVTDNGMSPSYSVSVTCMSYLGLMKRYSDEIDSTASVIASTHSYPRNAYSNIRVLRDKQRVLGGTYTPLYARVLHDQGLDGWKGKSLVTHIPLQTATEGYRGELDGVLAARNYSNSDVQWRTVPDKGEVTINGKSYVCIFKPYYSTSVHNEFDDSTEAFIYLIEKK